MSKLTTKNFIMLGAVDTGKSTVCGNLLYQTGNIDQHIFEKTKSEVPKNQVWSALLDIYEQERTRGKTHEYAQIPFIYNKNNYLLFDCPGHGIFIRNTIEALGSDITDGLKIMCLVINASDYKSNFENGSTKEHITLAKAYGIEHFILCINQMDSVDWSEILYNTICSTIRDFIKPLRFKSFMPIPISAYNGIGIIQENYPISWFKGSSLMNAIDKINIVIPLDNAIKKFDTDNCHCMFYICGCKSIITAGYTCILHYDRYEYEIEFNNIETVKTKHKFARIYDTIVCSITFLDRPKTDKIIKNRLVIRDKDQTIGYGKIIVPKN